MQSTPRRRAWRRLAGVPVVMFAALLCAVPAATAASASAAVASGHARATDSSDDWATFHGSPLLQGWASNSSLTTATAPNLGVQWATDLYGAAVASPVVAYDASLGESLAYVGTLNGDMLAINVANGQIVWSRWLGSQIRGSALVVNGSVWVSTYDSSKVYQLDAATGAVACSFASAFQIEGSPVAATPPGGVPTVYIGANDSNTASGPVYALQASNCAKEWSFTGYVKTTGSWDPLTYAVDASGEPLVLFGTSDPDSQVYALDAVTGKIVWHYAVDNPAPHTYDIGAGVVVSPPGVNGSADGVAYVESKYGIMYALDLTTGAEIWSSDYTKTINSIGRNIATAALSGGNLVLGDDNGLVDLNPANGQVIWSNDNPADVGVDSSPAIAGPAGSQVVAVGDLAGGFDVDSLATGAQLYHYQTGQYITSSPAVSGGNILISSADGFLYDFAAGGGNESTLPTAAITSPTDSSQVANPNGSLAVTGTATDQDGIAQVDVAVQEGGTDGQWWDAATGQWVSGPVANPATVASPGSTSSSWTFGYPVPPAGNTYQVTADTVSAAGQASVNAAESNFTVLPSASSPQVQVSNPFVPPGNKVTVTGSGFGASETVTIALAGQQVGTAQSTASGNVPATKVSVPTSQAFALTALTLTGETSGDTATTGITVANQWAQAGYNATHTGYEPNDPGIYLSIAAGSGTYMNLAWAYSSTGAVSGPPAVADTVAYSVDAAGDLVAVDVHSGAPLWTWSLPSRAALDSSPAVDTGQGLVFAGSSDGSLSAISTATGDTVWSDSIGGNVFAPVFSGGNLYVTTSSGTLEAVKETTGKELWSSTLSSPASAAPALDTAGKLLVVGESDGDVAAVSTSGVSQWSHPSGSGAVATPPVISGGVVYFGAGDSVYAVSESTGAARWSYPTGGQIASSLALTHTSNQGLLLTTGSADGHLYSVAATSGKLLWKTDIGSPITGVASAYATYVFDTSNGVIGAGRITSGERLWERTTTAGAMTTPVVVDGTVYAGGHNAGLYAFTTDGQPPA